MFGRWKRVPSTKPEPISPIPEQTPQQVVLAERAFPIGEEIVASILRHFPNSPSAPTLDIAIRNRDRYDTHREQMLGYLRSGFSPDHALVAQQRKFASETAIFLKAYLHKMMLWENPPPHSLFFRIIDTESPHAVLTRYGDKASIDQIHELSRQIVEQDFTHFKPIHIPSDVRFEHQFILAPSGSGKTTLIEAQLAEDFQKDCCVIVMDGENELIPHLAKTYGKQLGDRLIYLEPDKDHPLSLNVFDTEKQLESRDTIASCLATMNTRQDTLLSLLVELCLIIPNATLYTLMELLEPKGLDRYAPHLAKLDDLARSYFTSNFKSQNMQLTKEAVHTRLFDMMRVPEIRRMFVTQRNLFDMPSLIEQGSVILINTNRAVLGEYGCQMFGRFFLSQLMQAARTRDIHSKPIYCYVDECADYVSEDLAIAEFLDKARKRRVGMIFATQRESKIVSPNVRDALNNVAIRFRATGNETERGIFECFIRRTTPKPIEVRVNKVTPPEPMTEAEFQALKQRMGDRYSTQPETIDVAPDTDDLLKHQLGVVGLLWGKLEQAVIATGAVRNGEPYFNDLNISRKQRDRLHQLRIQRNNLIHTHQAIENLDAWQRDAQQFLTLLANPDPTDPSTEF